MALGENAPKKTKCQGLNSDSTQGFTRKDFNG